jgi:DNA (cytosine-5)-methyltransferase 1
MRVFLSQVKEWLVEYTCDMLFIIVRTDCAWYKIRSVAPAYAGWFAPILKAARLAVHLIGAVQGEARSARVSFADVVKRLAAQPPSAPTYLSSRADAVRHPGFSRAPPFEQPPSADLVGLRRLCAIVLVP